MNRREALRRVGLLLGGAVSSSVAGGVLAGCGRERTARTNGTLTPAQDELVATIAELILPETDTPGARAAGVSAFVDDIVTLAYSKDERERFLAGLADVERRTQASGARSFGALAPEKQTALLTTLAQEGRDAPDGAERSFFRMMKELTLVGYYTSKIGATRELQWIHAAGRYDGDVPLSEAGRAYV